MFSVKARCVLALAAMSVPSFAAEAPDSGHAIPQQANSPSEVQVAPAPMPAQQSTYAVYKSTVEAVVVPQNGKGPARVMKIKESILVFDGNIDDGYSEALSVAADQLLAKNLKILPDPIHKDRLAIHVMKFEIDLVKTFSDEAKVFATQVLQQGTDIAQRKLAKAMSDATAN